MLRAITPEGAELGEALADIRSGELVGLVAADASVIGGTVAQEALRAAAADAGGTLQLVRAEDDSALNGDDPADMRAMLREYERRRTALTALESASRLRTARARSIEQGGSAGGRPPFGWRVIAGELVEDARQQATIGRMQELYDQGLGWSEMARQLTVEQYRTQDGKTEWQPSTVRRIFLRNRRRDAS